MSRLRSIRQSKILDIISNIVIETQDDLVRELNSTGFKVTQATVSRDIKDMGLVKTLKDDGRYRYTAVRSQQDIKISSKFLNVYREAVLTMVVANNMVVVKTLTGSANAVAMVIDQLYFAEKFGTIAGDDTLIVIAKNNADAEILYDKLIKLVD